MRLAAGHFSQAAWRGEAGAASNDCLSWQGDFGAFHPSIKLWAGACGTFLDRPQSRASLPPPDTGGRNRDTALWRQRLRSGAGQDRDPGLADLSPVTEEVWDTEKGKEDGQGWLPASWGVREMIHLCTKESLPQLSSCSF